MSKGNLSLIENVFRDRHKLHWMRDDRCGHIFKLSIHELSFIGFDSACPFCAPTPPQDLQRFGSIEALQEHVSNISYGNIQFNPMNKLGLADDQYEFSCLIHDINVNLTFEDFIQKSGGGGTNGCPFCKLLNDGW